MARGTDFGGIHSSRDLRLIQQLVEVQPAEPKLNLVDIPGADGSRDLSALPAGRVVYADRSIAWTFALYPGEKWDAKHREVSNALNGRECKITLDTDPDYYYQGRLSVKKYNHDRTLHQITVEAICRPWIMKQDETTITADLTSGSFTAIILPNEKKPVIPTIEVTTDTTLRWKGASLTAKAGTFTSLDLILDEGENTLEARSVSSAGRITITYREGSL